MRKFTLFLSLFFAMAMTAMAQSYTEVNYNVELSTADAPKYYKIGSYDRGGFLTTVGDGQAVQHIAESDASYWYFTKANDNGGVYFHNYTTTQCLGANKSMSDEAAVWYILPNGVNEEGLSISSTNPISSASCIDANNYNTGDIISSTTS